MPPALRNRVIAASLALLALGGSAGAEGPALTELHVFPPEINLATDRDRQSIVVQASFANDTTRDVTAEAAFTLADPSLVLVDGATYLPAADGTTELTVAFEGREVKVPVTVAKAADHPALSYRLDVMPVFMKAGCNTGSCHGAARGKDGFRLSLFGFDPQGDYDRLLREFPGRRVNLAVPDASTVLEKGAGLVPHSGGQRFATDGDHYAAVREWIAAGAANDDVATLPTITGVELYPKKAVLDGKGSTQQMTVRATYSDGTDRDVTPLAVFLTNNENSAAVDAAGVVTAGERGEAFVMARFETFTVGSQFLVLPKGLEFSYPEEPEANYIDGLVAAKLRKVRIAPSGLCSDEVFLRRASIDLVGLIPTPEEYAAFLADPDPDKRSRVIDELLTRKEFSELWVQKWAEMLQVRTVPNRIEYKGMYLYYNWLVEQLSNDVPMDEMTRNLLSASGGTFSNAATNFYQGTDDKLLLAENVAQVFMGMRIQCAQCHNHPFDRWTQDDYYGFVAFFAQIGKKQGDDYRETIIFNSGGGETNHPVGGRVMPPKFLGAEVPDVAGKDRREVLAEWLASPRNPYFATSFVNRVWAHFFGIGIVEQVDDFRVSNPASNPELLDELARRFTESGYDLKSLVRDICNSRAYQRDTVANESNAHDSVNFARANLRRIKAENLLDIISQVTDTQDKFGGLPLGARAVQIADGNSSSYFLTTFGRATRATVCSCEVKMEPTLSQSLHLLNGATTNAKIRQSPVYTALVEGETPPEGLISDLYVRCLTRQPTEQELAQLLPLFGEGSDRAQALEDVFWALLNSREFIFNH
ncbi:DUF1549 domain-containing protein [Tautonia plasticadhaerens]|uniref:Bacterial Ig-like domain (Group 2) n=1 Tax=Tautonia plasticadhaerens TaxID=2527974 RepID=A0A518HAZ2_9BACT|nr:DUF1549 domain-containing protein [Tautonia plasticadhaerens]QDV38034.1 hypothetical protein ElP_59820 [Tautonia plasticadhaerens]